MQSQSVCRGAVGDSCLVLQLMSGGWLQGGVSWGWVGEEYQLPLMMCPISVVYSSCLHAPFLNTLLCTLLQPLLLMKTHKAHLDSSTNYVPASHSALLLFYCTARILSVVPCLVKKITPHQALYCCLNNKREFIYLVRYLFQNIMFI